MSIRQVILTVGAVLTTAGAALVAIAQPAAADSFACQTAGGSQVCINVTASGVNADIEVTSDSNFHSPTVAAIQCNGSGTSCGQIAASSDVGHLWLVFATSVKPYSAGHTYKAVASWTDPAGVRHVAVSTPLACCP
ncbi:MAG: hypothetical protein ABI140_05505 [Jatrophihabitantaceae bacterium]